MKRRLLQNRVAVWLLSLLVVACNTLSRSVDQTTENKQSRLTNESRGMSENVFRLYTDSTIYNYRVGVADTTSRRSRVDTIIKTRIVYRDFGNVRHDTIKTRTVDTIYINRNLTTTVDKSPWSDFDRIFFYLALFAIVIVAAKITKK